MPTLQELPEDKRKEVARALAQSAFAVIDKLDGYDGKTPPSKRLFKMLADAGPVHEKEFCGNGFSAARCALIDEEFDKVHSEALEHANLYDECVKPVHEAAPTFALPSTALVRMWCMSHYTRLLCKADGPFADLEMAEEIDDEDLEEESDEEEEEEESDEDYSEDDDGVIVLSSEEEDSTQSSSEDDGERERMRLKKEIKRLKKEKRKRKRLEESSEEEEGEEEEEEEEEEERPAATRRAPWTGSGAPSH